MIAMLKNILVAATILVYNGLSNEQPTNDARCDKTSLSTCIAQCLNLTQRSTENERCRYYPHNGFAINNRRKTNNSCFECGNPELLRKSPHIANIIAGERAVKCCVLRRMCRKTFFTGLAFPKDPEYMLMACSPYTKPGFHVWSPRSLEEIYCVLNRMPREYKDFGRMLLHVVKSNCSGEALMCDFLEPRPLGKNFPPITPSKKEIKIESPFFGSCVTMFFKYKNNNVSSLEFVETPCSDGSPFLCEFHGDALDYKDKFDFIN